MSKLTTASTFDKLIANLTATLATTRSLAAAESRIGAIAALPLITAVERALADLAAIRLEQLRDELAASLPRVSGGGHDDHEEIDAAIFDKHWPSYPDETVDGFTYELGATPLEVLARDMADAEIERSAADWDEMYAIAYPELISEADHVLAHGCV